MKFFLRAYMQYKEFWPCSIELFANAQSHGVSEFTILAFCLFQLLCTLFISRAERNFNKVRNCFPKPLLWKWRFDAPTEIRRHSNAFQAFEEIRLCRFLKLNEVQAKLIGLYPYPDFRFLVLYFVHG